MTPLEQSYREIPLTRGHVALVSAHRYEYLSQFSWYAAIGNGKMYAGRRDSIKDGKRGRMILMHREILGIEGRGNHVDHINGNGLDNRDENIRPASASQNIINRFCSEDKGIKPSGNSWEVNICVQNTRVFVGTFETKHDARIAYAVAARILHGEYRHLSVMRFE